MNLKKIVSLLLAVSMIFAMSVVSFAYTDLSGSYTVEGVASEIAEDGTFTYALYAYEKDNKDNSLIDLWVDSSAEWAVTLNFDANAFEINGDATPGTGLTYTSGSSTKGDGYYIVSLVANVAEINLTKDTPFVTFNFKKLDSATDGEKNFEITKVEVAEVENFGMISLDNGNVDFVMDTVTIGGGEEVFEPTYEGFVEEEGGEVKTGFASGSKVATVFAKATGDLAAGTYGIVFGGQKYVGAADVKDGKYWVIRLYDPSGNILTGASYTCQKFVGDAYETVDYELENN